MSTIKRLSVEEIETIYQTRMQEDFPPDELRPLSSILTLHDQGHYFALGYVEHDVLLAYAFFAKDKASSSAMLDYYAVTPESRGMGIGGKFLSGFQGPLSAMGISHVVLEVERVECGETDEIREVRTRRIRFYQRNHCRMSHVSSCLFGVQYCVMQLPFDEDPLSDEALKTTLLSIYDLILAPLLKTPEEKEAVAKVWIA